MAYAALYRKFRPANFNEVKGQDPIVTTLKNQIKSGKLSHAYLFCGTRGTGKTTIAKILAKAVNCENLVDGSPCEECRSCKAINSGSSINVVEIDAASNNGVDDIRNIREEIQYPPTQGKYKVYIIDEVHMLSGAAFNALLKTLEEPPEYVIFILATTEAHKIPTTISSRCQRYNFKRISIGVIVDRLRELMDIENINVEDKALEYIAKVGDGSMRDSLSLLDRCLAFYMNQNLTYDKVLEALGAVDTSVFYKLLNAILDKNTSKVISIIGSMINEGREVNQLLTDFIWYLRNLLLVQGGDNMEDVLDISSENLSLLKEQSSKVDAETIVRFIRVLSETSDKLRFSTQKRVVLEVAFIKLMKPEMEKTNDSLLERLKNLEYKVDTAPKTIVKEVVNASPETSEETKVVKPKLPSALTEDLKEVVKRYRELISGIGQPFATYLRDSRVSVTDNNKLAVVFSNNTFYDIVKNRKNELENYISTKMQKDIEIEIKEVTQGRKFEEEYIDIEQYIKMEVEIDDNL